MCHVLLYFALQGRVGDIGSSGGPCPSKSSGRIVIDSMG